MLFSQMEFLFGFLPLCMAAIYISRKTGKIEIIAFTVIILSLIYYIYWNPIDIIFIIATITINYFVSISNYLKNTYKVYFCVIFNVSYLLFFKLLLSAGVGISQGIDEPTELFGVLAMPLGISFITFQQITFVIDNSENKDSERSFLRYLFFVMFFPQLVSGPIVKHSQIIPQLYRKPFRSFSWSFFSVGICYFAIGLAKKVLIAEPLTLTNEVAFAQTAELLASEAWINCFMYSLRIYFDFSAYADMAIGLGYMLGIRIPRNFDSPYRATNISEFWRRWHITLYKFFKDYVFKRLVQVRVFNQFSALAVLVVMLLSGIWHGVGWGFLIWALGHAVAMIVYRQYRPKIRISSVITNVPFVGTIARILSIGFMFLLVSVLWVPFATNDEALTFQYFMRMADFSTIFQFRDLPLLNLNDLTLLIIGLGIVFFAPSSHALCLSGRNNTSILIWAGILICASLPLVIHNAIAPIPFLYFQF